MSELPTLSIRSEKKAVSSIWSEETSLSTRSEEAILSIGSEEAILSIGSEKAILSIGSEEAVFCMMLVLVMKTKQKI